jgi:hypothetical protein
MRPATAALTLAILFQFARPCEAQQVVISDTFGPGDTYDARGGVALGCASQATAGVSFVPTTGYRFDQAVFAMTQAGQVDSVSVGLFDDLAGVPGHLIEALTTAGSLIPVDVQHPDLSRYPGPTVAATSSLRPMLSAGSRYWLVAQTPNSDDPYACVAWWTNPIGSTATSGHFVHSVHGAPLAPADFGQLLPAFRVLGSAGAVCAAPSAFSADSRDALPAAGARLFNQSEDSAACRSSVDVRISNRLPGLWLGLERVRVRAEVDGGSPPQVAALTSSETLEDWARFRLIPPCRFDSLVDPTCTPGRSWWRTEFSEAGEARFVVAFTPRAAALTVIDGGVSLLPRGITSTEAMEMADELMQVPTIRAAAECLRGQRRPAAWRRSGR